MEKEQENLPETVVESVKKKEISISTSEIPEVIRFLKGLGLPAIIISVEEIKMYLSFKRAL